VGLFTAQFGAFVPWLVIHRGPLSALLHPNTGDALRDHTARATWLGQAFPLNLKIFKTLVEEQGRKETSQNQGADGSG
jgi:aromatic ring-cleaving dioxygenase